ncbi:hypothetical protein [Fodinicola feengrottensis]|uniref:hypothetical protein n=1 Tax=Fodinicola feengrottensis TaxID=435914 RepID=UPI0024434808|nr:hypothetical protein [Fodinicola feengrottensis]
MLFFFSGIGVLFYVVGMLVLADEDDETSPVEALFGRGRSRLNAAWTVLLMLTATILGIIALSGGARVVLLVAAGLFGLAMLLLRRPPVAQPETAVAASPGAPAAAAPPAYTPPPYATEPPVAAQQPSDHVTARIDTSAVASTGDTAPLPPVSAAPPTYHEPYAHTHGPFASGQPTAPLPPVPPKPKKPKERSALGGITFSLAVISVGLVALVQWATGLDWTAYFAIPLAVIGAGLLVGTFLGRARWLIPIGLLLCLVLGAGRRRSALGRAGNQSSRRPGRPDRVAAGRGQPDRARLPAAVRRCHARPEGRQLRRPEGQHRREHGHRLAAGASPQDR